MRIGIFGHAGTGKTTLAERIAAASCLPIIHVDTLTNWDRLPDEIAAALDWPDYVIEGLFLPRGLRRYFENDPTRLCPLDRLIRTSITWRQGVTGKAASAGRGQDTIIGGISFWLPPIEIS